VSWAYYGNTTGGPCDHEPTASHSNRMCSHNFPCGCGDTTIWDKWVVTLDTTTPFLNTLTIRGTLIVQHDHPTAIAIHANLIDIKGGRLVVGNSTHPFTGLLVQIVLHGDMYFHGKECTNPYDTYVSPFGCWKQMVVNGELSIFGKPVPVVSTKLVVDAAAGATSLRVETPARGWKAGDDLIVSSSDAGGVPEYRTIANVSLDGLTVHLTKGLASAKVGSTVTVEDALRGLKPTVLDGRATVSLLSRNVEIRGGYDVDYDYISGVGPDLTDYGATIRLQEAYSEVREGWTEDMAGFDTIGTFYYPDGWVEGLHYVRFRGELTLEVQRGAYHHEYTAPHPSQFAI